MNSHKWSNWRPAEDITESEVWFNISYLYPQGKISSDWFQMNASDQDDENEDMSDEQIIAVRRGEPVSVTGL